MKKQFTIAIAAIMLLSVLVVPPVMSSGLSDEITLIEQDHISATMYINYAGEVVQLKLACIEYLMGYQRRHPESKPTIPIKVDFANKTIDAGGKQLKLIEIKEINREDIIEDSRHGELSISGFLNSNCSDAYGPWYFPEGVERFVEIDHSPSDVDVLLAVVKDDGNGEGIIDSDHDGYACFDYMIPKQGDYYIIVGAPDGGFDYEGWLHWYW
jgi:hypothetical protein